MKMILKTSLVTFCLIGIPSLSPLVTAAPGDLDLTFSQDGKLFDYLRLSGNDIIYATALQPDGKVVAVGAGGSRCAVARYESNGALDLTFDGDGLAHVLTGRPLDCRAVALQMDGKIVVAGGRTSMTSYETKKS